MKTETFCKVCGESTYKPKQRIYTKYCSLTCCKNDPDYNMLLSEKAKGKTISIAQRKKISEKLKEYRRVHPRKRKDTSIFENYRVQARFIFALKNYPTEFDFSLLAQHGMYKAKNNGDNLYGVSRDHMISVRYGFDNKIPVEVIRHPANCRLLLQSKNASKKSKCSMTIEELYKRIKDWDSKYGSVA
jgi:hypothetical protein